MTIDLSDYEKGKKYKGDYDADLAALQERLAKIQVAHIIHDHRSVILFEGWDAAGKGGIIKRMTADWDPRPALGVVLAAGGYPDSYDKGDVIEGLDQADSDTVKVFHAGTAQKDGQVVTSGGRVLCVTGVGDTVSEAQTHAYAGVKQVTWRGAYHRTDIGYRAVAREKA